MSKMIEELVKVDGFSKHGMELCEAFYIFAKNGNGFLTDGRDNGYVCVWGEIGDMPKEDQDRLKELGWDHPQMDDGWEDYGIDEDGFCWSYYCM